MYLSRVGNVAQQHHHRLTAGCVTEAGGECCRSTPPLCCSARASRAALPRCAASSIGLLGQMQMLSSRSVIQTLRNKSLCQQAWLERSSCLSQASFITERSTQLNSLNSIELPQLDSNSTQVNSTNEVSSVCTPLRFLAMFVVSTGSVAAVWFVQGVFPPFVNHFKVRDPM